MTATAGTTSPHAARPRGDTLVVGLLADPGLATKIAWWLADHLPEVLAHRLSERVSWQVRVVSRALPLDERGTIPLTDIARESALQGNDWDVTVCVTELPREFGTQPVAADASTAHGAALLSVPALGGMRLRCRAREMLVYLVGELAASTLGLAGHGRESPRGGLRRRIGELAAPLRRLSAPDEDIDVYHALLGVRGRIRLLAGMVRTNRPWRLLPSLASAGAAAAAGAAFGIFYSNVWTLAGSLEAPRLVLINVLAIAAMTAWLVLNNRLWARPAEHAVREQATIDNAATVCTVFLGVACAYLLLFLATLAGAAVVIPAQLLQTTLGHPVGIADYLDLAWLASSMGIVAGALGSGLDEERDVQQATFSARLQQQRSSRHRLQTE